MHILIVSNYYPPFEIGGWEQLTRDVAQQLAVRGHVIRVVTSDHGAGHLSAEEPGIERVLHLESPDHAHYHLPYTVMHRWCQRQNQQHLTRVIRNFKPDIVFINGMWNLSVAVAQQAEQLCPNRVVYYMASYWPTEPDAHTAYWSTPTHRPWLQRPKQWVGALVRNTLLTSKPRNALRFDHVLCVSEYMRRHMVEKAGVAPTQTRVVHNGVEADVFVMRNLGEHVSPVRLLYAGRLAPAKGVHTLLEGIDVALKKQPTSSIKLSIVGAGTPEYERQLRDQVQECGLTDIVEFHGRVPREQMPEILAQHDVLLLPSIWAEPLARMTQEAMACGLVVIGTPTGGTPEILHDGENGLIFEAENALMLAEKIIHVVRNPQTRLTMARAARQTVEEKFTLQRMVDEIEAYFEAVLERDERNHE